MHPVRNVTILFLLAMCLFVSCKERKTRAQVFEENLDKNVEACALPLISKGVDTIAAREFCRCALGKIFAADSMFLEKSIPESEAMFDSYSSDFLKECYPLIEEYVPALKIEE